jgi:hypothetical protein
MYFPFFYSIWFSHSLNGLNYKKVNRLIVFDSLYSIFFANYIKKEYPWIEVSVYYRNHIDNPSEIEKARCDINIWSYDKDDCIKYALKYNAQFYFSTLAMCDNEEHPDYDFFFIGQIKGRGAIINEIKHKLEDLGYKVFFHVIDETNKKSPEYKYLNYNDIVGFIKKSRCIVDIVGEWQTGMTLRPLEALFNRKKLLTNYERISCFNFYTPNNIFIYGRDDLSRLDEFLTLPLDEDSFRYINEYDFPNWLNRF